MMSVYGLKPNTVCKNKDCHHGEDGGRKHYYSCLYCVHSENWRSMACCEECYDAYMEQIRQARSHGDPVDTYAERTDMGHEEVVQLVDHADTYQVIADTDSELAEAISELPGLGYGEIVDTVNQQLDRNRKQRK